MTTAAQPGSFGWLITDFVRRVPGVAHSVVVSADALVHDVAFPASWRAKRSTTTDPRASSGRWPPPSSEPGTAPGLGEAAGRSRLQLACIHEPFDVGDQVVDLAEHHAHLENALGALTIEHSIERVQNEYLGAAFLDGLARLRRTEGLPAISLGWGLWNVEGGINAGLRDVDRSRFTRSGFVPVDVAEGLALFDAAFTMEPPSLSATPFDLAVVGAADWIPPLFRALLGNAGRRRNDDDVPRVAFREQFHNPPEEGHVRAREHRQPHRVGVLLDRGLDDLLGRLVQPGVDDLHAGVPQGSRDDLRAAVVAVQPRLGDDDPGSRAHLPTPFQRHRRRPVTGAGPST